MKLEPCILVIFGATGDLTHRKLYPALYNLWREKLLPERFGVVSIGRREKTPAELRADITGSIERFSRTPHLAGVDLERFLAMFSYYRLDFNDLDGYAPLKRYQKRTDLRHGGQSGVFPGSVTGVFCPNCETAAHSRYGLAKGQLAAGGGGKALWPGSHYCH